MLLFILLYNKLEWLGLTPTVLNINKVQHCTSISLLQERLIRTIHIMTGLLLSHLKCHQGSSDQIYNFIFDPACSYVGEIIMHLVYHLYIPLLMSTYIVNSYDCPSLLLSTTFKSSGLNYQIKGSTPFTLSRSEKCPRWLSKTRCLTHLWQYTPT